MATPAVINFQCLFSTGSAIRAFELKRHHFAFLNFKGGLAITPKSQRWNPAIGTPKDRSARHCILRIRIDTRRRRLARGGVDQIREAIDRIGFVGFTPFGDQGRFVLTNPGI